MQRRRLPILIYLTLLDTPAEKVKFEELYSTYKGLMFYVANKILNNTHDAEEAVHDAFLVILENFSKISSIQSPKTKSYIVTIIENKAIDLYRKKDRHPQEPLSPATIDPNDLEAQTEDTIAKCILRLPPNYRQLILLRFAHGYSPRETAKLMGLSMDSVYKLEQRAKKKLEELCREEGITV